MMCMVQHKNNMNNLSIEYNLSNIFILKIKTEALT